MLIYLIHPILVYVILKESKIQKFILVLQEYKKICESLNDDQDAPSLFGLPANIERSAQRMNSAQVMKKFISKRIYKLISYFF